MKVFKIRKVKMITIQNIINNIINNYYLIYNNIEDVDKVFFNIQAIIQRKLTVSEKNILYKDYINKIILKK